MYLCVCVCVCMQANRYDLCCVPAATRPKPDKQEGLLYTFVKNAYSHFLMKEWVRPIVVSGQLNTHKQHSTLVEDTQATQYLSGRHTSNTVP